MTVQSLGGRLQERRRKARPLIVGVTLQAPRREFGAGKAEAEGVRLTN